MLPAQFRSVCVILSIVRTAAYYALKNNNKKIAGLVQGRRP